MMVMQEMKTPEDWHQVPFIFSLSYCNPFQPLPTKVRLECHRYHHDHDHEHDDDDDDDDFHPYHPCENFPHPRTQDLTPFVAWIKIPI